MKNKLSLVSMLLALIAIVGIVYQNYRLAIQYPQSDGKTQALFGIIELAHIDIKIYIGAITVIGILLGFFAIRKKEKRLNIIAALVLNAIAFVLVLIRLWRFMI